VDFSITEKFIYGSDSQQQARLTGLIVEQANINQEQLAMWISPLLCHKEVSHLSSVLVNFPFGESNTALLLSVLWSNESLLCPGEQIYININSVLMIILWIYML
jgi:hypothetical protein